MGEGNWFRKAPKHGGRIVTMKLKASRYCSVGVAGSTRVWLAGWTYRWGRTCLDIFVAFFVNSLYAQRNKLTRFASRKLFLGHFYYYFVIRQCQGTHSHRID